MAYCSKEAHSCVEKAAMIGFVKMRILEPDETCSLRGHILREVNIDINFSALLSSYYENLDFSIFILLTTMLGNGG